MKTESRLDLKTYPFPNLDAIEIAFSTIKTDKVLLEEAKRLGFDDYSNPYNELFSTLFFSGGKVKFKNNLDEEFLEKAWHYTRALMSSFEPKHEDKAAICALLLSELCEPKLQK